MQAWNDCAFGSPKSCRCTAKSARGRGFKYWETLEKCEHPAPPPPPFPRGVRSPRPAHTSWGLADAII